MKTGEGGYPQNAFINNHFSFCILYIIPAWATWRHHLPFIVSLSFCSYLTCCYNHQDYPALPLSIFDLIVNLLKHAQNQHVYSHKLTYVQPDLLPPELTKKQNKNKPNKPCVCLCILCRKWAFYILQIFLDIGLLLPTYGV